MSEGNVYVTVNTGAVAAEVSRLQRNIDNVAEAVSGVSQNIHIMQDKLLTQMGINVERLDAVKNEVSRSIEAAAQAKIVETAADIFGKVGIIESAKKRICQQYHKSVIRCGRISEKFDTLNDEVKDSYHTDIRRLGKYIFDIWDNHYREVEDRINKQHTGFLATIEWSVEQIRMNREQELEELFKAVTGKLEHFLGQRKNFHDSISMITVGKLDAPMDKIAIPIIIVKGTGAAASQIKIGHEVEPGENKHLGYCLKETGIFKTYRSDHSNLDESIRWRDMTPGELLQLESNLGQLKKKKQISSEYHELLVQGLKKNPPKVPEQIGMPWTGDKPPLVTPPPEEETGVRQINIQLDEEPGEMPRAGDKLPIVVRPPEEESGIRQINIQLDDEPGELPRAGDKPPIVIHSPAAGSGIRQIEIQLDEGPGEYGEDEGDMKSQEEKES